MTLSSLRLASCLVLPLASLAACEWNEVETGAYGQAEVVPDDCGKLYCDLDDGIAVGGSLDVRVRGAEGRSLGEVSLVSSAPWVVQVLATERDGFEPRFRIGGVGAGRADLIVVDRNGYELDYLTVDVAEIASLEVDAYGADLEEVAVVGADRAYQLPTGARLTLDVAGFARGRELTGEVDYRIALDAALATSLLAGSDLGRGHLELAVPAGDHDLDVTAPGGARTRVRISGR